MSSASEPDTRPYRMVRRAKAFAETRQAILDAANEIRDPRTPLSVVAAKAGVSERTVLRHFGSRDGLVAAAIQEGTRRDEAERFAAPAGDVASAVASLVAHYETAGDRILRLLAEEGADRQIDEILAGGRAIHWRWVEEKLGPLLEDSRGPVPHRRLAQLAAICDVYTWKLMRRDGRLGRTETERSIRELIEAVVCPEKGPAR
jgi:AcrR family transcriptional regulator